MAIAYPDFLRSPSIARGNNNEQIDMVTAIRFDVFQRESESETNQEESIFLYMPTTLNNPINTSWEQKEMKWAGNAVTNALQGDGIDSLKAAAAAIGAKDVFEMAKGLGEASVAGIDAGQLATRQIANPYLKMLFRGVGMRTFEYEFKFTPRSRAESNQILRIINRFRECALPDRTDTNLYLTYPKQMQITYLQSRGGQPYQEIAWMNKFKPSVITQLNVNYAAAGYYVPMADGFPSETTLTMQFTETEIVTRGMIREGF